MVKTKKLTRAEVAELGNYEFMAYIGVPYFRWGGMESTDRLVSLCEIDSSKRVLIAGCGTGYSACHIAQSVGCEVVGFDISEMLVAMAQERAENMGLQEQVTFIVADGHDIPYESDSFDVLLTESVALFMDKERALKEFSRVVVPDGYVGLSEGFRAEELSSDAREKLDEAESLLSDNVGVPVAIPTQSEWKGYLEASGLEDIQMEEGDITLRAGQWAEAVGRSGVAKVSLKAIYHMIFSRSIRKRLGRDSQLQKILFNDESLKGSFGVIMCIGRKRSM
ncbi:MAG: class I SAM-dependent methyltransferase [Candidatus Thorarchaeota archaeon]|jgi:ubiquinone/menaquinone biosynthesis C-methylase UbiE